MKKHLLMAAMLGFLGSGYATAADGDIAVTVDLNGTRSKNHFGTVITNHWFHGWESIPAETSIPKVGITQDFEDAARMNDTNNDVLSIQAVSNESQQSYYMTVRTEHSGYYISAYNFNAVPAGEGVTINGTPVSTEGTLISGTGTAADEKLFLTFASTEEFTNVALRDFTITLSPVPAPAVRYMQVPTEHYLVDGAKYVVGHVGVHETVWGNVNPVVFTANAQNNGFTFTSVPNLAFDAETMVFTAKVRPEYICGHQHANHAGPHKVLQLYREANGSTAAIKINGTSSKSMAALTDLATNIEFVPVSESLSGLTNDPVFELHVNLNPSDLTSFRQIHAILKDGTLGWYSRGNSAGFDILKGDGSNATSSYSGLTRVYLQIDSENLAPAAAAIWNGIVEADIAAHPDYADEYKAALRAREVPDASNLTVADLENELLEIYNTPEFDKSIAWTPENTVYLRGDANWNATILSTNVQCYLKLAVTGGANNMKKVGSNFDLRGGSAQNSEYVFSCYHPLFTVMGFEFNATGDANTKVAIDGVETPLSAEAQKFSGVNTFTIKGTNTQVLVPSFTVGLNINNKEVYDVISANGGIPQQSGWYQISHVKGLNNLLGNYIVAENEFTHNGSYYGFSFSSDITAHPAASYVYVDVENGTIKIMSPSGHWMNANATLALTKENATSTAFTTDADDNTAVQIANWTMFNTNKLGSSGTVDSNRWVAIPVNAAGEYDIWTVEINGLEKNASDLSANCHVTCAISANKGLQQVYDNGKFFFAKGTVPAASDFTVSDDTTDEFAPVITVDAANKTIIVDHYTKQAYVELKSEIIDNGYAPYVAQEIYDSSVVEAAVADAHARLAEAAGEASVFLPEELAAMNAAVAGIPTADEIKAFSKSAEGKLVQFANGRNEYSRFMTVNNNNIVTTEGNIGLSKIWVLETCDENGHFTMKNYLTGKYASHPNANSQCVMADEADATRGHFTIAPNAGSAIHALNISYQGNTHKYFHDNASHGVVGWQGAEGGSLWIATVADSSAVETPFTMDMANSQHNMTFEGAALHDGVTYAEHHAIVIRKIAFTEESEGDENAAQQTRARVAKKYAYVDPTEPTLSIVPTSEHAADGKVVIPLGSMLDEGNYEVTVPSAIFMVGDKHSKSSVSTISVDANGGVTGIDEVAAVVAPVVEGIYDLQGRKLAKPVKGINIINGRKVLVK